MQQCARKNFVKRKTASILSLHRKIFLDRQFPPFAVETMTCIIDKNVHLHARALQFVEDFLRRIRLLEISCDDANSNIEW